MDHGRQKRPTRGGSGDCGAEVLGGPRHSTLKLTLSPEPFTALQEQGQKKASPEGWLLWRNGVVLRPAGAGAETGEAQQAQADQRSRCGLRTGGQIHGAIEGRRIEGRKGEDGIHTQSGV